MSFYFVNGSLCLAGGSVADDEGSESSGDGDNVDESITDNLIFSPHISKSSALFHPLNSICSYFRVE